MIHIHFLKKSWVSFSLLFHVCPQRADMAAASCVLSEDQFLCCICLDVFTDPVTTPCGHNFCKTCITEHFDINVRWQCPMCKQVFRTRPELHVNTFISAMVAQFRQEQFRQQQESEPGPVPCDVCTGTKVRAVKSCLACLVSFCDAHLEPHLTEAGLKKHQLMEPVENLQGRMCRKHSKPLELFCKTDQTCICLLCPLSDHKTHKFVPLTEEYEGKKEELLSTDTEIQQMILERQLQIEEIDNSVKLSQEELVRETAKGVQVFTSLIQSVGRGLDELVEMMEERQRLKQTWAEVSVMGLEEETCELRKRSAEVTQLLLSEDPLHFLQRVQSLNIHQPPPTKVWVEVGIRPPSHRGAVVGALARLEETLSQEMKKLMEEELRRVQQDAVDVTLDPDTAHPCLLLSDGGKQVGPCERRTLPDNPERFSVNPCVLGRQSFSSGRFYFEVQVTGKKEWDCGVARASIIRKQDIPLCPEEGYWAIWLRKRTKYRALTDPPVHLCLKSPPQKVGVFVDYDEGLVSFYDVDAAALIFSFTGCLFNDKLHPYFNPGLCDGGRNSAPLVISAVQQPDHL